MKKVLLSLLSIILILSFITMTYGSNLSDLKNQYNNTQDKIDDKKEELNDIKKEQKDVLTDIDTLSKEINKLENEISKLNSQINELNVEIDVKEIELEAKLEEMKKQEDLLKTRAVAVYESGNVTMLDVLLGAEDLSDFLSKYYMMAEITDFDNKLLEELSNQKKEIESIKEKLEADKTIVQESKASVQTKSSSLSTSKKQLQKKNAELESNKEALSKSIDKLLAESNKLESQIRSLQSTGTSYAGGEMAWPLPGYSTITSPYGMRMHPTLHVYKMHTGIDIAGSGCYGKNIVAANDGKVITATYNSGYGNMVVIDHGGGITTLYGHASKLLVSVGQKVKRGQAIAQVGSTGYSTGAHLHFEVRVNGATTNPLPYVR